MIQLIKPSIKSILTCLVLFSHVTGLDVSLSGKVITEADAPLKGCIVSLRKLGLKDTTNTFGQYRIYHEDPTSAYET